MLKFIFWLLLIANGALFAFQQGFLGRASNEKHEPTRLAQQLQTDQLHLITEAQAQAGTGSLFGSALAAHGAASTPTAAEPATVRAAAAELATPVSGMTGIGDPGACIEIGSFNLTDAERFQVRLKELGLSAKAIERGSSEKVSYMVYVPASSSAADTNLRVAQLRKAGINDFFVLPTSSAQAGGVSLGIFKTEDAANTQLALMIKKGVRDARIERRNAGAHARAFELRQLNPAQRAEFDKLAATFRAQHVQNCSVSTSAATTANR